MPGKESYTEWYDRISELCDEYLSDEHELYDDLLDAVECVRTMISFMPNPRTF